MKSLCVLCFKQLKKQWRKEGAVLNIDDNLYNDEEERIEDSTIHSLIAVNEGNNINKPQLALFLGLFCGSIPNELIGMTTVEDSMINIYSAITNVCTTS